jgi:hypothetical protein
MQIPFFGSGFDRLFPILHFEIGEKISVDVMDFAQVIRQDLRVKDSFHVFFFQNP